MPDPKRQQSVLKIFTKIIETKIKQSTCQKFQNPDMHASSVMRHPLQGFILPIKGNNSPNNECSGVLPSLESLAYQILSIY